MGETIIAAALAPAAVGRGGRATFLRVRGSEIPALRTDRGDEFSGSDEDLLAEIARLTEVNRAGGDRTVERRLLWLRHLAGMRRVAGNGAVAGYPEPDVARLPEAEGLPDVAPGDLSPELLRAGILRDGCVLVRGLVDRERAVAFAEGIERAFADRDRARNGGGDGTYEEFRPDERFNITTRELIRKGGGLLAVDAPDLAFEMLEMLDRVGLPELVAGYLGEAPVLSVQKTTLRRADPSMWGAWHQDGTFMGDTRPLNLWLALSRCGDEAPGLDLVPRRLDHLVAAGTEGTFVDIEVTQANVEEAAGAAGTLSPVFEPGDALLFDDLFLHRTGSHPSMSKPRYAIESWFFGGSGFPVDYAPIAV